MDVQLEQVVAILKTIMGQMEDLWIERQSARATLLHDYGMSPQQVEESATKCKADPECRKLAREAYSQMQKNLEGASTLALIEELSENPPPTGESN